jgi:uncharacterized membrane protein YkoI
MLVQAKKEKTVKEFIRRRWVVPVAALVLTLAIGSVAFAATGSSSTDTSAAGNLAAVINTVTTVTTPAASTDSDDDTAIGRGKTGADPGKPWGNQRSDETLLTGDALTKVQAAAIAKAGSDATLCRVETDADGNAAYEVHMVKADGTLFTVYVDESYNVVSVEDQPARGQGGGHHGHRTDGSERGAGSTGETSAGSGSTATSTTQ